MRYTLLLDAYLLSMKKMQNKYKNALDGISARFLYRKLPVRLSRWR